MTKEYKFYRRLCAFVDFILGILFKIVTVGRENIPEGAALICANHSSWSDPLFAAVAFGKKYQLHFMAKAELLKNFFLSRIIRNAGSFGVDRDGNDISAVRNTMKYLRSGEKVVIFPEGTRTKDAGTVKPKSGVVHIADKTDTSIVPVYIPRKKSLFSKLTIIIGKPYKISAPPDGGGRVDYDACADDLMSRINGLPEAVAIGPH